MKIRNVKITDPGSGYSKDATCTFSDGNSGAIHAKGKCKVADGKITGVELEFPGKGYDKSPTINFDDAGGGTGAKAEIELATE